MAIILLDEDFYKEGDIDGYISNLIYFVKKYFDLDVSVFHPFCNVGNSWAQQNMLATIQLKLQKIGKLEIFDSNMIIPVNDSSYDCLSFSPEFIGQINFLLKQYDNIIIPVTQTKHESEIKSPKPHVYIINHIYKELNSNIAYFIINNLYIHNVLRPNINSPLPNSGLCEKYYDYQKELIKKGKDKLDVYSDVAKEVANRNTFILNKQVSNKNKNKGNNQNKNRREIYDSDKKIYISTDFESGCFEYYNSKGKHQGERSYTDEPLSPPDKTGRHDIKV